jgi:hypothetical protein
MKFTYEADTPETMTVKLPCAGGNAVKHKLADDRNDRAAGDVRSDGRLGMCGNPRLTASHFAAACQFTGSDVAPVALLF